MANLSPQERSLCWSTQKNQKRPQRLQSRALQRQPQGEECGHQEEARKHELHRETWRSSSAGVTAASPGRITRPNCGSIIWHGFGGLS